MKFVSIDIETTGLDPKTHQILEVGACIVDTEKVGATVDWPKLRMLLTQEEMDAYVVDPFCAHLNADLFKEISEIKNPQRTTTTQDAFVLSGHCPAKDFPLVFGSWVRRNGVDPVIPAGKNFGSFDRQFLERLPNWKAFVKMAHRTYDPAPYFFMRGDKNLPNLDTCCERAGIPSKSDHTALSDALLVARLCIAGLERSEIL